MPSLLTNPTDSGIIKGNGHATTEVHLLALVHGMWGQPSHLSRLAEIMNETHAKTSKTGAPELDVLVAETNRESHTYDGVDWGAERVVKEIHDRVATVETDPSKKVTRFSILGYSLGGLLARYAVGILYSQGFFDKVVPLNFATVATPNIGLVCYPGWVSALKAKLGPIFLSRTGEHFFATDVWEGVDASQKKPLLEVMSEKGGVFYDGLTKFKHITIYANAINDLTVPFVTAAIEPYDPFVAHARTGVEIELDEKYAPIIKSYNLPLTVTAEEPALPRFPSTAWWSEWWNRPSKLPSPFVRPFPWNVLVYLLLPLLVPLFILVVVGNFSYATFHSRRRIRLLESTEGAGNRSAIMQLMRNLERGMEDAVVEFLEDDMVKQGEEILGASDTEVDESGETTPTDGDGTPLPTTDDEKLPLLVKSKVPAPSLRTRIFRHRRNSSITYTSASDPHSLYFSRRPSNAPNPRLANGNDGMKTLENQPVLKPTQLRMLQNLNTLPNLRKEFAFLDNLRNSHAAIVCRDLPRFEFHRRGEGVLRKFADAFEL